MEDKKETARENLIQGYVNGKYPTLIEFESSMDFVDEDNEIYEYSDKAIKITVKIDSNKYDKGEVGREIELVFRKILESFN